MSSGVLCWRLRMEGSQEIVDYGVGYEAISYKLHNRMFRLRITDRLFCFICLLYGQKITSIPF